MRKTRFYQLFLKCAAAAAALFLLLPKSAPVTVRADDTAYGVAAYQYLREITDKFPYRINNNEIQADQSVKQACGRWIDEQMRSFGYVGHTMDINDPERNHGNFVQNYIYEKPGLDTSKKILLGAHYDSVPTKGTEDNGTGIATVLEIAKRLSDVTLPMTVEFCFWDGEEYLGLAGSFRYVWEGLANGNLAKVLLYINLDCVGAGDKLFAYGGKYVGDVLTDDWGYNLAKSIASDEGIELNTLPDGIQRFKSPTRTEASDQIFFAAEGVPYVYFEANAWSDNNGTVVDQTRPYNYNTNDPRVTASEYVWNGQTFRTYAGQIVHSSFDDLDTLEELFPGRIQAHMADVSKIVTRMLKTVDRSTPGKYNMPAAPPETTAEETTKAPEETTAEETAKAPETTAEETTEPDTAAPETEPDTTGEEQTVPDEADQTEASPTEITPSAEETHDETGKKLKPAEIAAIVSLPVLAVTWAAGFFFRRKRKR